MGRTSIVGDGVQLPFCPVHYIIPGNRSKAFSSDQTPDAPEKLPKRKKNVVYFV